MKETFLLTVSIAIFSNFYSMPISAQQVDNECRNAINEGYTRISNTGATFAAINIGETKNKDSNPFSSNNQLNFFLSQGQKTLDVINSRKLLGNISNKIIQSCPSIVSIAFVLDGSDYESIWFRVNDNKVILAKCVKIDRVSINKKLFWGYVECF